MSKDTNDYISERIDNHTISDLLDEKRRKRLISNRVSAHKYREKQKTMIQSLQFDLEQKDKEIKILSDTSIKLTQENKLLKEANYTLEMKIAEYDNFIRHITTPPNTENIQENSLDSTDIRANDTDSIEDFTGQSPQFDSFGDLSNHSSDHDVMEGFFGYSRDNESFEDRSQFWHHPETSYDFLDPSHNFDRINSYFIVLLFIFPIFIAPYLYNYINQNGSSFPDLQQKRYGSNDLASSKASMSFSSFGQNKRKPSNFPKSDVTNSCIGHSCSHHICPNVRLDIEEYFIRYIGRSLDHTTIDECINNSIQIDVKDKRCLSTGNDDGSCYSDYDEKTNK